MKRGGRESSGRCRRLKLRAASEPQEGATSAPPKSLMPASSSRRQDASAPLLPPAAPSEEPAGLSASSASGVRLGGAWMLGPSGPSSRRATATVQSSSERGGQGAVSMAVPFLGTKFCTMSSCRGGRERQGSEWVSTCRFARQGQPQQGAAVACLPSLPPSLTWMCPYRWCRARICSSASTRSRRVSPMPVGSTGGRGREGRQRGEGSSAGSLRAQGRTSAARLSAQQASTQAVCPTHR